MSVHVHRVSSHVISQHTNGLPRWCFYCRRHVAFTLTIHASDDPMSYYGPHSVITCENGHADGDCFPGRYREWGGS